MRTALPGSRPRIPLALALAVAVLIIPSARDAKGEVVPDPCEHRDFIETFDKWAFGLAPDPQHRVTRLFRWVAPVVFVAVGDGLDRYATVNEETALELSILTNHPIFFSRGSGNSVIYISDDPVGTAKSQEGISDLEEVAFPDGLDSFARDHSLPGLPFCAVRLLVSERYHGSEISSSVLFVDTRFGKEKTKTCIRMVMAEALGAVAVLKETECTIFSRNYIRRGFTSLDKELLSTLYSRELVPGMDRDAVLDAISQGK